MGGLGTSRRPGGSKLVSGRSGGRLRAKLSAASAACALRGSTPPSGPILCPVPCSPRRSPAARLRTYCWNTAKPTFDRRTFDFQTKDAPGIGGATRGARYGRTLPLVGLAGSRPRRPPRSCVRLAPHPRAPLFHGTTAEGGKPPSGSHPCKATAKRNALIAQAGGERCAPSHQTPFCVSLRETMGAPPPHPRANGALREAGAEEARKQIGRLGGSRSCESC